MNGLACLSVSACRMPLRDFERLSFGADVADALPRLRKLTGADQLLVLSTCERLEVYAHWSGAAAPETLAAAAAEERGLAEEVVRGAGGLLVGDDAAKHLLRVAAGLESFVLGESDIVGQVRAAWASARSGGGLGLELDRLLGAAVHASRRVHRETALGSGGRSVAAAAVRLAVDLRGSLAGHDVVVVGAGRVAGTVVTEARTLGARVTVCNRTRRHAERFVAAGATVVDLGRLSEAVARADVLVFATAAPHRLLDAPTLSGARGTAGRDLLVLDLCVPRNVDPAVRDLPAVQLCDLAELRGAGSAESAGLVADVAHAERVVEEEVARYRRWLAGRSAAASVRRLRSEVEACAREETARLTRGLPEESRSLVEEAVRRTLRRVIHRPTRALLEAAEAGDGELVDRLAALFATPADG
jgi:glutamyl-tRNA reductase